MSHSWVTLREGDVVIITAWPPELKRDLLHADTAQVYERLIADKMKLRVHHLDEFGVPFGEARLVSSGDETWHFLALNHSNVQIMSGDDGED